MSNTFNETVFLKTKSSLDDVVEQLKPIAEKYDYSKLPEDI